MVSGIASSEPEPDSAFRVYRSIFAQLDEAGAWAQCCSPEQLVTLRRVAKSDASWRRFLSGQPLERSNSGGSAFRTEDTASAIKDLVEKISQPVDAMELEQSDGAIAEADASELHALAALVRRRISIALVDERMFGHYTTALDSDDRRYEEDQGLMSGDDGGYTNFDELLEEDAALRRSTTGVYKLLGSDAPAGDTDTGQARSPRGPRKRPRYSPPPILPHFAAKFVCDAHNQLAAECGADEVGKLKEAEKKAGEGDFESADECIEKVRSVLEEIRGDAFDADKFEQLANNFKLDADPDEDVRMALEKLHMLTVGILGTGVMSREDMRRETVNDIVNSAQTTSSPAMRVTSSLEDELCCWPAGRPEEDGDTAAIHQDDTRVPIFSESDLPSSLPSSAVTADGKTEVDPRSFADMLGNENPILQNVLSLEKILTLKNAILSKKGQSSSPALNGQPETTAPLAISSLEIQNVPQPAPSSGQTELLSGARQRALGVAVTSLVLEHAGFTHSSLRALETLTDAWEQFIARAGARLSSARERIADDAAAARVAIHTPPPPDGSERNILVEHAIAAVMGGSDLRGGFTDLIPYGRYAARRAAVETAATVTRLEQICIRLGVETTAPAPEAPQVEDGPVPQHLPFTALNEASWSFGLLPQGAVLDVLGPVRVPRTLALATLGCPEPGSVVVKEEEIMEGSDTVLTDVMMRDSSALDSMDVTGTEYMDNGRG